MGVLDIGAEPVGGLPGPTRVVKKGAGKRHAVGAAVGDDRFCLVGIDDHPDRLHAQPKVSYPILPPSGAVTPLPQP